ncbi:MAG: imidazole glycerol phosphate synthase subunit HisH [Chloroflexi bacterium]|nr:imidazole glycerol phosphate synthase subunit HisH [Chloroflexota bacterium]
MRAVEPEIVVVDYGAGNLRSVAKALERLGASPRVTSDPRALLRARGVVLPGVGSSGTAMAALEERRLVEPLRELMARGTPFFGVCLGMQLLFQTSEEDPRPCLGILPGRVRRLPGGLKVPHMGWNQVALLRPHPVFQDVPSGSEFYFVHSYYGEPADASLALGTTDYGVTFCSAVARGNLVATQFHPEKSGPTGLRLYENFLRLLVLEEARPLPWR